MDLTTKKVGALLFLFGIGLLLIVPTLYWFITELGGQLALLSKDYNVVTVKTAHGYWPGSILAGLGILIFSSGLPFAQKHPSAYRKALIVGCSLMLLGMALFVIGAMGSKIYWNNHLEASGYVQCSETKLADINRINQSIWAKRRAYCDDPGVARRLNKLDKEELKRVHEYLQDNAPHSGVR